MINDLQSSFRLPLAMDKTQFSSLLNSLKYTVKLVVDGPVEKHVSTLGNKTCFLYLSLTYGLT